MSGSAKNGRNTGIKCGFLNLQPESVIDELISKNCFETDSTEFVEIIPASWSGIDARVFPSLTTIIPPLDFESLLQAKAMSFSFEPITIKSFS